MPAFEAEVGMPYWIDLTTSEPRKSANFYEQVLGWEVSASEAAAQAESENPYRIARIQGLPVAGLIPQDGSMPDTWMTYFLSRDIEADCARATELGGRVVVEPQQVEHGLMALLADVADGMFGLIQPAAADRFVAAGEPGCPVWHELAATSNFKAAMDFYGELFNWELRAISASGEAAGAAAEAEGEKTQEAEERFEYATAEEDGAAFAGLWNAEGNFPPHVPSFWQTYLGVRDLDAAVAKATELGGEVIRAPWDSPFGRMCLLADATGATITLTEVEDAPEEEPRESDDVLNLE